MLLDIETLEGDKWDKEESIDVYIGEFFENNESLHGKDEDYIFTYYPHAFINALIILDKVKVSPNADVIAAAEHDQIYFEVDKFKFATLSTNDVLELIRAGVNFCTSDGFYKYV